MRRLITCAVLVLPFLWVNAQTRIPDDGTSPLWYKNTNIGIGTNNPQYKLDVLHSPISGIENLFRLMVNDSPDYFRITNGTGATGQFIPIFNGFRSSDNRQVMFFVGNVANNMDNGTRPIITFDARRESSAVVNRPLFSWDSYGNTKMILTADGVLGIGTSSPNPSHKLEVAGTIRAEEIKVEAAPWADFVFEKDYNLRPLQEVNTYIEQNGHLPEIPTAKEVEENGISLGEMNAKLLQKIEELTLYVIELKEENEKQNKVINQLMEKSK